MPFRVCVVFIWCFLLFPERGEHTIHWVSDRKPWDVGCALEFMHHLRNASRLGGSYWWQYKKEHNEYFLQIR